MTITTTCPSAPTGRQPTVMLDRLGLRLRRWTTDDAPALLIALRDPLVERYTGYLLTDRRDAVLAVQAFAAAWTEGTGAAWALSDGAGTLLGSLRFGLSDPTLTLGTVGYWLSPQVRGAGVASAAVEAGTRTVFERLRWHRIELRHALENERSCAVARRTGYTWEGTLRDGQRYPADGRWSDEHLHARLAHDPPRSTGPDRPGRPDRPRRSR